MMPAAPDLVPPLGAAIEFLAGMLVGGIGMRLLVRAFSPSEQRTMRSPIAVRGGARVPSAGRLFGAIGKGILAALIEAQRAQQKRVPRAAQSRDARDDLARLLGAGKAAAGQAHAGEKGSVGGFVDSEARRLLAKGDVVAAIAFVRQATGMGIADSKAYVTRLKS